MNTYVGQKRDMSFHSHLTWEDQFSILNAGIFRNQTDIISPENNKNCQLTLSARKFINDAKSTIFSSKGLKISCLEDFENRGSIKSEEEVNLYASGKLINKAKSTIFSSKDLKISCFEDFENNGSIKSEEEVNLYASGKLLNFGTIQSNNLLSLEAGRLKNQGNILGDVTDIKAKISVQNEGPLKARDLSLTTSLMVNTHGIQIAERGQVRGSLLLNKGSINSKGSLALKGVTCDETTLRDAREFLPVKQKPDVSQDLREIAQERKKKYGSLTNQGSVSGKEVRMSLASVENSSRIYAENYMHLDIENILKNTLSGLLSSGEDLTFESRGHLINEGLLEGGRNISLNAAKLENKGRVIAKQKVDGRFGQRESRNVPSIDFTNRGLILGQNVGLNFVKGTSRCLLKNNIDLSDPLSFEGIVALNSLCLQVEDDFENEGHLLGVGHAQIIGTGNIHQRGILQSQGNISLLGTILENSHLISARKSLAANFSEDLTNTGSISGQDNVELKAHSITNKTLDETSPALLISKNEGVALAFQTLQNNGEISGREFVSLKGLEGENSGAINGKKISFMGREFSSEETLSDLSQGQYHSGSKFANRGRIYGQDHLSLNVASLDNRGELTSGEDLTISVRNLRNDDSITAERTLSLIAKGQAINNHVIQGSNGSVSISAHTLENHGTLKAANCPLNLKVVKADNHNLIFGQEGITLQAESLFTNHKNEKAPQENKLALVQSPGSITISGEGRLRNDSFFESGDLININLGFDNAGVIHANEGVICKSERNSSTNEETGNILTTGIIDIENAAGFTNQGHIRGSKATLKTRELSNEGTIRVKSTEESPEGVRPSLTIEAHNGQNSGTLRAEGAIDIHFAEQLENSGDVLSGKGLTFESQGHLINEGLFESERSISLKAEKLENAGRVIAKQDVEGRFASRESKNISSADFTNRGLILGQNVGLNLVKGTSRCLLKNNIDLSDPLSFEGIVALNSLCLQIEDDFENEGHLLGIEHARITGTGNIHQRGILQSQGDISLLGTSLENSHLISAGGAIVSNLSEDLTNIGSISGQDNVELKAHSIINKTSDEASPALLISKNSGVALAFQTFQNSGEISGREFVSLKGLEGENSGAIKGKKISLMGREFFSEGASSDLDQGKYHSKSKFDNKGQVHGQDSLILNVASIDNRGELTSGEDLTLSVRNLRNDDTIIAERTLSVTAEDKAINNHIIQGSNGSVSISATSFENHGQLSAINCPLDLKVFKGDNHNLIFGQNGVALQVGSLFTNHRSENTSPENKLGLVQSPSSITISGEGRLRNDSFFESGDLININAGFDNAGVIHANEGIVCKSGENSSTNEETGNILTPGIVDIENMASFTNQGHMRGSKATLKVGEFSNEGTIRVKAGEESPEGMRPSLTITAQNGRNSGVLRAIDTIDLQFAKQLENSGNVISEEEINITGEGAIHQRGVLQSQGNISLSGASLENSYRISAGGAIVANLSEALTNTGVILGQDNVELKAHSIINKTSDEASPALLLSKNSGIDLAFHTFQNSGKISGREFVNLRGLEGENSGAIKGKRVSLVGSEFSSEGALSDLRQDQYHSGSKFENNGQIHGQDRLNLNLASLENRGELTSGEDLTLSVINLRNDGSITAERTLSLTAEDQAINNQVIQGSNGLVSISAPSFENHGHLSAIDCPLDLKVIKGENHNLIFGQEGITLQIGSLFTNHRNEKATSENKLGLVQSPGSITISGEGRLRNDSFFESGDLININVGFDNAGVIHANEGVVCKSEGKSSTNEEIGNILTTGIVDIENAVGFTNQGHIKGAKATLKVREFSNEGTIRVKTGEESPEGMRPSLTIETQNGQNLGVLRATGIIDLQFAKQFENSGDILSKEAIVSGGGTLENRQSGTIQGTENLLLREIGLNNAGKLKSSNNIDLHNLQGDVQNQSTGRIFSGGKANLQHTQAFHNFGKFQAQDLAKIELVKLENSGLILSPEGDLDLLLETGSNEGTGRILAKRNLHMTLDSLGKHRGREQEEAFSWINKGDISSERELTLSGKGTVKNQREISGQEMSIDLQGLTNEGRIEADQSLAIQVEELSNSNLIQCTEGDVSLAFSTGINSNHGKIISQKSLSIQPEREFSNLGEAEATGALSVNGAGKLENKNIIASVHDLTLDLPTIVNSGELSSLNDLWVKRKDGRFTNEEAGTLLSSKKLILQDILHLKNRGEIQGQTGILLTGTHLENENHISSLTGNIELFLNSAENKETGFIGTSQNLRVDIDNQLNNQGHIRGGKATLKVREFSNEGTIRVKVGEESPEGMRPSLTIETQNGQNSGVLRAEDTIDLQFAEKLENSGNILSKEAIISGEGILENKQSGTIQGAESLILQEIGLNNAGKLESSKNIDLHSLHGNVQNQSTGEIYAGGDLIFENQENLINEGLFESGKSISLKVAKLENAGRVIAKQDVDGRFAQRAPKNASLADFTNRGLIIGQNVGLNFVKGTSRSLLKNNIDLSDPLSFEGIVALNSLCLQVEDDFENEGHLLGVGHVQITGTGNIRQKGILQSQGDISLLGASLENSHLVSAGESLAVNFSKGLINTGVISGQNNVALKAYSITNKTSDETSPALIVSKNLGIDLTFQALQNSGKISGREFVSLRGLEGENSGDIEGKKVSLVGREFSSEGALSDLSQGQYPSESRFENRGWIHGQDRLNLNIASLSNPGELTSGEDLTLGVMNLRNDGSITAERTLSLTADGQAINNQIIKSNILFLKGHRFHNASSESLKSAKLTSTVNIFKNSGSLNIGEGEFKGNSFKNTGCLTSADTLNFSFKKRLKNTAESFIKSEAGIRLTTNILDNDGEIEARGEFTSILDQLSNRGTLISGRALSLNDSSKKARSLKNAAGGTIKSDDTISLAANTLENEGTIEAHGVFTSILDELSNGGTLKSGRTFSLNNLSKGIRSLKNAVGGMIKSEAGISLMANVLDNAGDIEAWGELTSILDELVNRGTLKSGRDLSLNDLSKGVRNDGIILSQTKLSINSTSGIVNTHIIEGRNKAVSISAHSLENRGLLNAVNCLLDLKVVQGDNHNLIFAQEGITFQIGSLFTNHRNEKTPKENKLGLVQSPAFITISGEGRLRNHSFFESGDLININLGFDNAGTIHANEGVICRTEGHSSTNESRGNILTSGDVDIENAAGFTNQGHIKGSKATLKVRELSNEGAIYIKGREGSSGGLTIAAQNGKNSGSLKTTDKIHLQLAQRLENSGNITSGDTNISGGGILENRQSGTIQGRESLVLREIGLNNAGKLGSSTNIELHNLQGDVHNQSTGEILSGGRANLQHVQSFHNFGRFQAQDLAKIELMKLENSGFIVSTKGDLDLALETGSNEETGHITAKGDLRMTLDSLGKHIGQREGVSWINKGNIVSGKRLTLSGKAKVRNQKGISGQETSIALPVLTNEGTVKADKTLAIQVEELSNSNLIQSAQGDISLSLAIVSNEEMGRILAKGDLRMTIDPRNKHREQREIVNKGDISSERKLTLSGKGTVRNQKEISGQEMSIDLPGLKNEGRLEADNILAIQVEELSNSALIQSTKGDVSLTFSTGVNSGLGKILSQKSLSIQAEKEFSNSGEVESMEALSISGAGKLENKNIIAGVHDLTLNLPTIVNSGELSSLNDLWVTRREGGFKNEEEGVLLASNKLTLQDVRLLKNSGKIHGQNGILLTGKHLENENLISSLTGNIELSLNSAENKGSGFIGTNQNLIIDVGGQFDNQGQLVAEKHLQFKGKGSLVNKGTLEGGEKLSFFLPALVNQGTLSSDKHIELIDVNSSCANKSTGKINSSGVLDIRNSSVFTNQGEIIAVRHLQFMGNGSLVNEGALEGKEKISIFLPTLANQGTLTSEKHIELVNVTSSCVNEMTGKINSSGVLDIRNSPIFTNRGEVVTARTFNQEYGYSFRKLTNEGLFWSTLGDLKLTTDEFENTGSLESDGTLTLVLNGLPASTAKNTGSIQGKTLFLAGKQAFDNKGLLRGEGNLTYAAAKLTNQGALSAGQTLSIQSDFTNEPIAGKKESGKISTSGQIQIQSSTSAENLGVIIGNQGITGSFKNFTNHGILSSSAKEITLTLEKGANTGTIGALQAITLKLKDSFTNSDSIISKEGEISFLGTGHFTNSKTVDAKGAVSFRNAKVTNSGTLSSTTSMTFDGVLNGVLNDKVGQTEGQIRTPQLEIKNSSILTNKGKINVPGHLNAQPTTLTNQNHIQAGTANVQVSNFNNSGQFLIEKALGLTTATGNNTGEIQGYALTLQPTESFTNAKILRGTHSVSFKGAGVIQNKDKAQIFSSGEVSIENKKLENSGHLQVGGDVGVVNGASLSNTANATFVSTGHLNVAQKGALSNEGNVQVGGNVTVGGVALPVDTAKLSNKGSIQVEGNVNVRDGTSLTNTSEAMLASSGNLNVAQKGILSNQGKLTAKTVTYHPDTFTNGGEMRAGTHISFPNCKTFKNDSKKLVVSETGQITLPKVLSFNNAGQISSPEDFSLSNLTSFTNTGAIVSAKKLTVTSSTLLDNKGNLQGKGGANLTSSGNITNHGKILSEENVSLKGKEIHNHVEVNGEKGVSLMGEEKISNAGPAGINSKDGEILVKTKLLQNNGPIKGNQIKLDTQSSPTLANIEAVKSLTICSPNVGFSFGGDSRTFGHDLSIIGPLRDLPKKGASIQVKGNFTWENIGDKIADFINIFDIRVEGVLTMNLRGTWTNQGKVEALGGTNATLRRFKNEGSFYGGGNSRFECGLDFNNYGDMRFADGVHVDAKEGSITNHPKSEILQTNQESLVSFNAKNRVENMAGTVNIRGKLESTSSQFINRVFPPKTEQKMCTFKQHRICKKQATFIIPEENLAALFYVGSAHIKASFGQNIGGLISSREKIHFEGDRFHNLSQTYSCEGIAFVRRKKHDYNEIPYEIPLGADVAKFYSQGDMVVEISKTPRTVEALRSLAPQPLTLPDIKGMDRHTRIWNAALWRAVIPTVVSADKVTHIQGSSVVEKGTQIRKAQIRKRNKKFTSFRRKGKTAAPAPVPVEPDIKNTGDIQSHGALKITAPEIQMPQFSAIPAREIVIPAVISLDMYLSDAQKSGRIFWIQDTAKQTEFFYIPSIPIVLISEESIAAQLSPAHLKSKQAAEKATQEFKQWIIKRHEPRPQGKRFFRRGQHAQQSTELDRLLALASTLHEFWEPDVEELGEITPVSLTLAPPRIAVLKDPRLIGGERMRFNPSMLADLISKALLDNIGFASLSRHIYSPMLLSRVLEEQGYLNARRIHGRPALPAPQNWEQLSAQQRLTQQLREILSPHELEKFNSPAVVYELVKEHGELVLSALITLPEFIRKQFQTAIGRMVAHYWGLNSTHGDTTVGSIAARDGISIDAAKNVTTSKVLARKSITVQAKGNYHNKGDVAAQKGSLTATAEGTLHNQGTLEGQETTLKANKMIIAPLVQRERTGHGYRDTAIQPSVVSATGGDVTLTTTGDTTLKNANLSAAQNLNITAGETVSLGAEALKSEQKTKRKTTRTTEHKKSSLAAPKGKIGIKAPHIKRGGVTTHSKEGTIYEAQTSIVDEKVHDQHAATETKKKGNSITGRKKTTKQSSKSTPVRNKDTSEGPAHYKAGKFVKFSSPQVSGSITIFETPQLVLETAEMVTSSSIHKQGSNVICQSKKGHDKSGRTHTMPEISGPIALVNVEKFDLEIPSATPQKTLQKGKHKAQSRQKKLSEKDFRQAIAKAQKNPLTAWVGQVLNHPNVRVSIAVDEFNEWKYSSHSLSLGGAALISLAAILATGGAAAGLTQSVTTLLGGGVGASMAGTGASAAFQTLVTQAGISLANNQGNIGKTLKDLGSSSSVRSLVTAAGTAGLTYGLSEALGISEAGTSVGGQLQKSAVQAGVSTGFSIITQDQSLGEALLQGVINVGANTAGGLGAKYIGDIYVAGNIDALTHKALHALLGAIVGAASNRNDPGKGAAGGAIGAVGAEIVTGNLPNSMEPQTRANAGLAVGTALAVAAGQDGNAAILAATNAVMNNNLGHYSPDPEIAEQEMKGDGQTAGDIAKALLGAHTVDGVVRDVERFIDLTIEGIESFGEEGRALAESLADAWNIGGPLKKGLESGGKNLGLGAGVALTGVGFLCGGKTTKANPGAKPNSKALKQTPGTSLTPTTSSSVPTFNGPPTLTPVTGIKTTTAVASGTSKGAPKITPPAAKPPAKDPEATNLAAAGLAEKAPLKKRVTFKSSVEPSAKAAGKPFPGTDVAPKPILKSSSSTKKASTSYEKTSSKPASSTSRSPQAPSTAPPAAKTTTGSLRKTAIPSSSRSVGRSASSLKVPSISNVSEETLSVLPSGKTFGAHKDLVRSKANDSHHIIQDAAVKDIPGYRRDSAPAIQLEGPSMKKGTEHNKATQAQRRKGGGTYGAERRIGYRALREAGVEKTESRTLIEGADEYFKSIGVEKSTKTRIPGNRKESNQ